MKPDYALIARLERDIFGEASTVPPQIINLERRADSLEEFAGELLSFVLPWRPLPPELAGSRLAWAGKLTACSLQGFAVLWVVLMVAGVVPWSS